MTSATALRRDVAFMRTEWLLFAIHFKRIALPLLATTAIIYLPVLLATLSVYRFRNPNDANQMLDAMAIMLLFFHTLPLSRTRQWVVLIAASFTAMLSCGLFFGIIRPSAIAFVQSSATL